MTERDVLAVLVEMATSVFGIPPAELDDSTNLLEFGLDSLMFIKLGQRIEQRFNVRIEMAWFFKTMPSLRTLAAHIAEYAGELPAEPEAPSGIAEGSCAVVDEKTACAADDFPGLYDGSEDDLSALFRSQADALSALFTRQLSVLASRTSHAESLPHSQKMVAPEVKHDIRGFKIEDEEKLSPQQEAFLDDVVQTHIRKTGKSRAQTQQYRHGLADWKNTLSFRKRIKEAIYPIIADGSSGAHFTDLDGNDYIDIALGMGVNFMGHRHPKVVEAVEKRLAVGFELGPQCNMTGRAADLVGRLTGMERVCFCNTGSEAVMIGLRLARAKTKRRKVALFNGSYHGIFDGVLGVDADPEVEPLSPGTPPGMIEDIVLLDYDSPESLAVIEKMSDELAAVLVEPVQSRRPALQPQTFLRRLRKLTADAGIALIFDEMVNGFRIAPGGAQEYFGIRADIALYGKIIGGGLPVGVIAGSAEYLDLVDGGFWQYGDDSTPSDFAIVFGGTFCRHPFAMEAVSAVAEVMLKEGPALQDRVNGLAATLADELNLWFQDEQVPLRIWHFGSQFKFESYGPWSQLAKPIELELFFMLLIDAGVYVWERRTCCLSVAHTDQDIREIIRAVKNSVVRLRSGGFPFRLEQGAPDLFRTATSVQNRIFAAMQRENGQAPYHMPAAWIVGEGLDIDRLEICFAEIIKRHECLRSGFRLTGGRLVRMVIDEPRFFIERLSPAGNDPQIIIRDFLRPFDLEKPPLVRVGVAPLENGESLLMFDSLHIVVDGISLATLTRDLDALYSGSERPAAGASYSQYERFMQEFEAGEVCAGHLEFWKRILADAPPQISFSRGKSPVSRTAQAGHVRAMIDSPLRERIRKTAASCGVTPYMVMLSVYSAVMRSLAGTSDMVIGVANTGRPEERFDSTIGMFVNTVPLRLMSRGGQTFREFLNYVREVSADAYEHQDAPYELIVDRTADVVGTMFTFEVADDRSLDLSGMITREIEVPIPGAMFDISLDAIERNGVVYLDFEYDSTVLDEQIVRSWADCYTGFIESVCENPDALIGAVPLIPNNQFHDLFSQRNDNNHEHQGRGTVLDIIDAITVSHPDAPAVIEGGQVTTYAELNAISDHAAEMLISRYGIGPENLVAVCAPASVEVVAVILGILKAGGAFLPLEHDGPDARATRIFDTDNVSLLIGGGDLFDRLNAKKKCPITSLIAPRKKGKATTLPRPSPNSLAYVIYTSGSTGRPKGCEIEHASLYNYVVWAIEHYFFGRDAGNFCLTSSLAFDLSLMSLFVPLCMGSILRIPEGNTAEALALAVSTGTETDVLNLTPSHIRMIGSLGVEQTNVKIAVVGGEALRREDIDTLLALKPDMEIHNEYGPTEATIGCTSGRVFPGQPLTVGYPISNTIAVIVDNDMRPVPHGAWGELCIGGAGLARGYRNLPELTRERFIPFGPDGQRVYRTGDIARMMADGCIELGGRIDEQLKIGGHRIEPGEIESALMMCEGVSEAAVVQSNGDSLVAFVVGEGDSEDIRRESALLIPAYMVPRFVVMTSVIPVLPSGKIDRKTLVRTAGELTPRQTTCDDKYPVSPCLRIMRELSGNPEMRPSDNFFTAGGNSLDAVAVVARCRKELGLPIDLGAFFSNPTAETIERCGSEEPGFRSLIHTPKRREIPQTSGQKQIWLASQKGGSAYAMTEMFLFEGALDVALFHRSFMELVKRHEILRTTFHERGGELYQTVQTFSPESLYYEYIDRISGDDPECAAIWRADEESRFMFDLAKGPLVRVIMIPLDENRHLCLLNIHHIITDGWSAALMLDEVSRIYRSVISEVEKPGWQYRDFAVWHEEYLSGSEAARDLDFWRKALVPPLPELSLPGRCANDGTGVRPSGIVDIRINTSVVQSLEALARENGATLFMAILTGCAALMHQRTSAGDIVIGTPSAGRVLPEFETMPGYFLNTVPIRIAVDGGMTFRDLLRESVRRTSDAFAHQLYPFDLLADKFAGAQSDSRNPLFDVMVILQNTADYRFDLPEVTASRFYTPRSSEAKFEIMIEMETSPDGLCGIIEYDRSVYPKEIMESFARDLQTTLRHIVCSPDIPVSSLFAMFSSENNLSRDRFIRSLSDISEDF